MHKSNALLVIYRFKQLVRLYLSGVHGTEYLLVLGNSTHIDQVKCGKLTELYSCLSYYVKHPFSKLS